jgi:hypothetical protein
MLGPPPPSVEAGASLEVEKIPTKKISAARLELQRRDDRLRANALKRAAKREAAANGA